MKTSEKGQQKERQAEKNGKASVPWKEGYHYANIIPI